jgi:hypothetical protein
MEKNYFGGQASKTLYEQAMRAGAHDLNVIVGETGSGKRYCGFNSVKFKQEKQAQSSSTARRSRL